MNCVYICVHVHIAATYTTRNVKVCKGNTNLLYLGNRLVKSIRPTFINTVFPVPRRKFSK